MLSLHQGMLGIGIGIGVHRDVRWRGHVVLAPAAPVADGLGGDVGAVQPLVLAVQHQRILIRSQGSAGVNQPCVSVQDWDAAQRKIGAAVTSLRGGLPVINACNTERPAIWTSLLHCIHRRCAPVAPTNVHKSKLQAHSWQQFKGSGSDVVGGAPHAPDRKAGILKTPLSRWVQLGTREGWIMTLHGGSQALSTVNAALMTKTPSPYAPAEYAPHMVVRARHMASERRQAQVRAQRA